MGLAEKCVPPYGLRPYLWQVIPWAARSTNLFYKLSNISLLFGLRLANPAWLWYWNGNEGSLAETLSVTGHPVGCSTKTPFANWAKDHLADHPTLISLFAAYIRICKLELAHNYTSHLQISHNRIQTLVYDKCAGKIKKGNFYWGPISPNLRVPLRPPKFGWHKLV